MEMWETQKADLRRKMKLLLKGLLPEEKAEWDRALSERVLSLPEIKDAEWVYGYMSLPWEAGTERILEELLKAGKRVALPRVSGSSMDFFEINSLQELFEGAYHIPEPGPDCPLADARDAFILVPGLAFTPDGERLGKGGGYYDRFLSGEPDHGTAALAYEFQMTAELPTQEHDRRVDMVVTPGRIYKTDRFRKGGNI